MDKKKTEICLFLQKNNISNIEELSKVFNKTKRSIRNDIEEINQFLNKKDIKEIEIKNGEVISYFKNINIKNEINTLDYYSYSLDSIERRVVIILYALTKEGMFTLNDISEFMKVSRTTAMNGVNNVKKFINIYGLEIHTEASKGIQIGQANTKYKFDFILDLIKFDIGNIIRFFNQDELVSINNNKYKYKEYINMISEAIVKFQDDTNKKFTDYSFKILLYFISIYMLILDKNELCEKSSKKNDNYINFISDLEMKFGISIGKNDKLIFKRFFESLNFVTKEYENNDLPKIQIITRKFIEEISEKISINLNFDDDLLKNLSKHLSSIMKSEIKIEEYNFINEILEKNESLFDAVITSISEINKIANRKLNQTEIGFILIYIIAAIEKQKNLVKDINVLIICAAGIGTSYYIKEKVKKVISYANIYLANSEDYKNYLDDNSIDIIISNIKIEDEIEHIYLKNILDDSFLDVLSVKIDEIRLKKIKVTSQNYQIDNSDDKSKELNNKLSLTDILRPEYMQFDIESKDWKDSIYKSSKLLIEKKIIEEKYVEAMIKNIEDYGPYIVISKGVAIPHASSHEGVNKTSMGLVKLKNPVEFGAEGLDPVEYVITLSSINNEHFYAFFDLVNGLQNEAIKQKFMSAKNSADMVEVLREMEEQD